MEKRENVIVPSESKRFSVVECRSRVRLSNERGYVSVCDANGIAVLIVHERSGSDWTKLCNTEYFQRRGKIIGDSRVEFISACNVSWKDHKWGYSCSDGIVLRVNLSNGSISTETISSIVDFLFCSRFIFNLHLNRALSTCIMTQRALSRLFETVFWPEVKQSMCHMIRRNVIDGISYTEYK